MNKFKRVFTELKRYKSFIITSHIKPEGDAIGSQLALAYLFKTIGKEFYILNSERPSARYKFLPNSNKICTKLKTDMEYDAICFLDCADVSRIGEIHQNLDMTRPKINIDHHMSNTHFGDLNLVDTRASSTAEILYMLFQEAKVKIHKKAAECLYTAILTDTGSFGYSNVTALTHKITAHLIEIGVDTNKIYKKVYEQSTPAVLRLLSCALSTLSLSKDKRIAWMHITKDMLKKSKASLKDEEDFVNYPRSIKRVKVAMLFTEITPGKVKVNFRSNDDIDVNEIASKFGGGGHQKASGCVIDGDLQQVKEKVLAEVKSHV